MVNRCGSCTACCRVYAIPELKKKAGDWCQHCAIGKACKIYDAPERPEMCRTYKCLWLESHEHEGAGMSEELRPDRCKVVFSPSTKENLFSAVTMPGSPDAWRKGRVRQLINTLVRGGVRVVAGSPTSTTKVMIDRFGEHDVEMTEPDEDGMQWSK